MSKETTIRNPKKPSERDLKVLAFMDEGNRIDTAKALGLFKTTALRDIIYRLRCAGYEIHHQDISYTTATGESKCYRSWFTKDHTILKAGEKVEKQVNYAKEKSSTQYANEIIESARNHGAVQVDLFPAYQEALKSGRI